MYWSKEVKSQPIYLGMTQCSIWQLFYFERKIQKRLKYPFEISHQENIFLEIVRK